MQQSVWGEINPEAGHLCLRLLRQPAGRDRYPSDVWDIIIGYTFDRFHDLTNEEYVDRTTGIRTAPQLPHQQSSRAACGATEMISPHPFVTHRVVYRWIWKRVDTTILLGVLNARRRFQLQLLTRYTTIRRTGSSFHQELREKC